MITCLCGGNAYTRDELVAMKDPREPDFGDHAAMWYSLMGPESYYCSEEDDVLTNEDVKRAKKFSTKFKREATALEVVPRWGVLAGYLSFLTALAFIFVHVMNGVFG